MKGGKGNGGNKGRILIRTQTCNLVPSYEKKASIEAAESHRGIERSSERKDYPGMTELLPVGADVKTNPWQPRPFHESGVESRCGRPLRRRRKGGKLLGRREEEVHQDGE